MNTNDDIQQGKLTDMLIKLSTETDPNIEEYIEQLKNIYVPGFRHSYSNITAVVFKIYNENSQALTTLGENLFTIENLISNESKSCEDNTLSSLKKSVSKLQDHIALEQIRLNGIYTDTKNLAADVKNTLTIAEDAVDSNKKLLDRTESYINETISIKTEVITILGVFCSFILAFIGGMTFSNSVLSNMHQVSIYRIVLIVLLMGFVLFNILYSLFYLIQRLIPKKGYINQDSQPVLNQNSDFKTKYMKTFNFLIILFILVTLCFWHNGVVEKRNAALNTELKELKQSQTIDEKKTSEKQSIYKEKEANEQK